MCLINNIWMVDNIYKVYKANGYAACVSRIEWKRLLMWINTPVNEVFKYT